MQESLSQRTLKNAAWQVFNLFWVTVLNLFVTPLLLKNLGVENYGVYLLILTAISFLSLLDFGMGAGFTSSFIEYTVQGEEEKRMKLVHTFFLYWLVIGLIGFLILFVSSFYTTSLWNVRTAFLRQAQLGFWFAGLYFCLTTLNSFFSSMAVALQRFDIIGKVTFLQNTILNLLLMFFAVVRPSLTWLFASHFLMGLVGLVAYFTLTKKSFHGFRLRLVFHRSEFSKRIGMSFFNFISGIANNSLFQIDRFFVSRMLGNVSLSYYAIPNNLAQKIYAISTNGAMTLFPVASRLNHKEETDRLRHTFRRAMKLGILFVVFSGAILLTFGRRLLLFWLGPDIASASSGLLNYFVPTYVLMSIYMIVSNFYLGTDKSKVLAMASACMAIINICCLIILIPRFGITGAAIAYVVAVLPVLAIWRFFEVKKLGARGFMKYYGLLFLKIAVTLVLFAGIAQFVLLELATSFSATLAMMIIGFIGIMGLYWLIGFVDDEDKQLITGFSQRCFSKIKSGLLRKKTGFST